MKPDLPTLQINDWTIRYRDPSGEGPHPVIWLFLGWMGDEGSMWIFVSLLPETFLVLAPRCLYPQPRGGFGWYPRSNHDWSEIEMLLLTVNKIRDLEENWPLSAPWADFSNLRLAGFSQGAALAYAYTIQYPEHVKAVAGLAGFLPEGLPKKLERSLIFVYKKVYISHGTLDKKVPGEKGTAAAR